MLEDIDHVFDQLAHRNGQPIVNFDTLKQTAHNVYGLTDEQCQLWLAIRDKQHRFKGEVLGTQFLIYPADLDFSTL